MCNIKARKWEIWPVMTQIGHKITTDWVQQYTKKYIKHKITKDQVLKYTEKYITYKFTTDQVQNKWVTYKNITDIGCKIN